jgi:hypothetical protein
LDTNTQKPNHFCNQCKKEKLEIDFSKTEIKKTYSRCKLCVSEYNRLYRNRNKEKHKKYKSDYYFEHKNTIQEQQKLYKKNNLEKISKYKREYFLQNKDQINEYHREYDKNRKISDISFKLRRNLSKYISIGLKKRNLHKNSKSIMSVLPYSISELKIHIEKQFEPWMIWENQGSYDKNTWNDNDQTTWTWQVDHIIPHSTFKYLSMEDEEFTKCWSLENLRPYPSKQNLLDGALRTRHNIVNI